MYVYVCDKHMDSGVRLCFNLSLHEPNDEFSTPCLVFICPPKCPPPTATEWGWFSVNSYIPVACETVCNVAYHLECGVKGSHKSVTVGPACVFLTVPGWPSHYWSMPRVSTLARFCCIASCQCGVLISVPTPPPVGETSPDSTSLSCLAELEVSSLSVLGAYLTSTLSV